MNSSQLVANYQTFLHKNQDKTRAQKTKAYLYSGLIHYGIPASKRDQYLKSLKSDLLSLNKKTTLCLINKLWSLPSFEEKSFALHLLNLHHQKLELQDMSLIEKLMRDSGGWAFLDSLIIPIMPHFLQKYPQTYSYLKKWIKDSDFWVRRSALLAQLLFFRKGSGGNKQLFFDLAASQFDESWINQTYKDSLKRKRARFFIRKAIGWSLREMSQKDPQSVITFVNKYKKQMSGLTYREATRKLSPKHKSQLK